MHRRMIRIAAVLFALALAQSARADFIDLWADKTDMPADKAPPRGHSKLLVIPVQIDYSGQSGTYTALDLNALNTYFTSAASASTFNFAGYLKAASNNRYTADVTIAPLVEYTGCPATLMAVQDQASECVIPTGSIVSLTSDMDFVRDVFNRAHSGATPVDFSQFDVNGLYGTADGTIDGVMIVVNIPGAHLTLPISYVNGGSNLSGGSGGSLVLDGVKIPYVSIGGATQFPDGTLHYETEVTAELGKQLGLANLGNEHTTGQDSYPNWQGLHFSAMGDWNFGKYNYLPDPESRRALAWQDQIVLSGTQTLTLQPAANGGPAVKLGMMVGGRTEYYLAEVRAPVGAYDSAVVDANGNPTVGLAVYHVDWSVGPKATLGQFVNQLISCLDCTPWHPFIANVESNGMFDLVFDGTTEYTANSTSDDKVLFLPGAPALQSIANAGALSASNRYLGTNFYDGTASGISITNVQVNGDNTVTATFTAPEVSNPCADVSCPPLMVCATTGQTAGSCVDMTVPVADGGSTTPTDGGTHVTPPAGGDSGCASGGSSAMLWVAPLALLLAFAMRKRTA